MNSLDVPARLKLEICSILNQEDDDGPNAFLSGEAGGEQPPAAPFNAYVEPTPSSETPPAAPFDAYVEPTPSSETPQWNCTVCTLVNDAANTQCEACTTSRPQDQGKQSVQHATQVEIYDANMLDLPTAAIVTAVDVTEGVDVAQVAPEYANIAWGLEDTSNGPLWACKLCGYDSNRMIEAFCERCCEHISHSHPEEYEVDPAPIPQSIHSEPSAPDSIYTSETRPCEAAADPYSWLDTDDVEIKSESNIKYPSLRDEMFNHNEDISVQNAEIPDPLHPVEAESDIILKKRTIRLPWQSKYKMKKVGEKSKTARAFEKIAFSLRKTEEESSSEDDSSSSDDSSDENSSSSSEEEEDTKG